jgi:hypothetical protein
MGCSQNSRSQTTHSIQPKPKQAELILSSETSNTLSQTNLLSRFPTVKTSYSFPCLKIKLSKQFPAFILEDLTSLDQFSRKMHNIRKFWIVFQALKSNFECQVHSVCIKNFNFKYGLNVLLVVAAGKYGSSSLTFFNDCPFISINSQGEDWPLFKAWNELVSFVELVKKKGFLEKVKKYALVFQEFISSGQSGFYVKKALKIALRFIIEVQEILDVVSEVSKGKLETGVKSLIQEASCAGWTCPKYVVHVVLKKLD